MHGSKTGSMGGGLTKAERQQVFRVFAKIDADKKQHLSIEDLKKYCPGWTKPGMLEFLKCANSDKDGNVSPSGFDAFCKNRVVYGWSLYDRTGSGTIDVDDVKRVLYQSLKNAGDDEIDAIANEKFKEWDSDNDGKVSLADFTEYVIKCIAAEKDPWEFAQD